MRRLNLIESSDCLYCIKLNVLKDEMHNPTTDLLKRQDDFCHFAASAESEKNHTFFVYVQNNNI